VKYNEHVSADKKSLRYPDRKTVPGEGKPAFITGTIARTVVHAHAARTGKRTGETEVK
jgi:hypothetical protein